MPLFEFECQDCGKNSECLIIKSDDTPTCSHCGSQNLTKLMAAHSSASGPAGAHSFPGPGDTSCCGSRPGEASGCAGPGSCCGRA